MNLLVLTACCLRLHTQCSTVVEAIPRHRAYAPKDPKYLQLRKVSCGCREGVMLLDRPW